MRKGVEILKEVSFAPTKEGAKICEMEYSEEYKYMQVLIDWDKREIRTFLASRWNSSYHKESVVHF